MRRAVAKAPDSESSRQQRLALSLIDSVGYDGALRFCRNNSWDGVLRAIRALPRDEDPPRRPS